MLKKIVKSIFDKLGYKLVKKNGAARYNIYNSHYLSRICKPETVIDIGVGYGTHPLYEAFPDAYFILIEPVEDYHEPITEILNQYAGTVHYIAAGQEDGVVELDVDLDDLQLSSHFERTELTAKDGHRIEKRKIEMKTLDSLLQPPGSLERPLVLKIDTEGNELNVLKGAGKLLESTDYVIAEASIVKRFEGSYEFDELVTFMAEKGFKVFSILSIAHSPKEIRPRFADIVFSRA